MGLYHYGSVREGREGRRMRKRGPGGGRGGGRIARSHLRNAASRCHLD